MKITLPPLASGTDYSCPGTVTGHKSRTSLTDARLIIFLVLLSSTYFPQSGETMKFEVASVRPHRDVNGGEGVLSISGPRLTIRAFRPRGLLTRAFRVKDFQISSAT